MGRHEVRQEEGGVPLGGRFFRHPPALSAWLGDRAKNLEAMPIGGCPGQRLGDQTAAGMGEEHADRTQEGGRVARRRLLVVPEPLPEGLHRRDHRRAGGRPIRGPRHRLPGGRRQMPGRSHIRMGLPQRPEQILQGGHERLPAIGRMFLGPRDHDLRRPLGQGHRPRRPSAR